MKTTKQVFIIRLNSYYDEINKCTEWRRRTRRIDENNGKTRTDGRPAVRANVEYGKIRRFAYLCDGSSSLGYQRVRQFWACVVENASRPSVLHDFETFVSRYSGGMEFGGNKRYRDTVTNREIPMQCAGCGQNANRRSIAQIVLRAFLEPFVRCSVSS